MNELFCLCLSAIEPGSGLGNAPTQPSRVTGSPHRESGYLAISSKLLDDCRQTAGHYVSATKAVLQSVDREDGILLACNAFTHVIHSAQRISLNLGRKWRPYQSRTSSSCRSRICSPFETAIHSFPLPLFISLFTLIAVIRPCISKSSAQTLGK